MELADAQYTFILKKQKTQSLKITVPLQDSIDNLPETPQSLIALYTDCTICKRHLIKNEKLKPETIHKYRQAFIGVGIKPIEAFFLS